MSSSNAVVKPVPATLDEVFEHFRTHLKTMTRHDAQNWGAAGRFEELCQTIYDDSDYYHDDVTDYYATHYSDEILKIFGKLDLNTLLQVQTFFKIRDGFAKLEREFNVFAHLFSIGPDHDHHIHELINDVFLFKIEKTGFNDLDFYNFYCDEFVQTMIDPDKETERKALGEMDLQDKDSWADLLIVFLEKTIMKKTKEDTEAKAKKPMTSTKRNDAIVSAAIASKDDIIAKKIFTRMLLYF
jgi:hypothetical protein